MSSAYDLNGNLTSDGTNAYMWNARDQLASVSGGATASFSYDGLGRRRSKTATGTTTAFLYDSRSVVQELSGGSPTANLSGGTGIDEILTRADANGTSTLLADALGSTVALTDSGGTVQTTYTYEPFGQATVAGTATSNSFAFTGLEADGTGLMFYRSRYYDPRRQRFASADPIGFAGGVNHDAYVGNAPTLFVDPLGLKRQSSGPGGRGGGGRGGAGGAGGAGAGGAGSGAGGGPSIGPADPNKTSDAPSKGPCSGNSGGGPGALSTTIILDPLGVGVGPAVTVSTIPSTGETIIAPGVGASLGHNVSVGPLVGANTSGILPGWSASVGYNATPWEGGQMTWNSSGMLSGNSVGVPGASATATYGFCVSF